jgi:hypothetical protein
MAANEGTYLYCFARSDAVGELKSLGVDGRSGVQAICTANIAAVCSQTPLAEFHAAPVCDREPDLQWLIPRACRHEAVIEEVMERSPVLPVRFGALFSSPFAVQSVMARQSAEIDRFLDYAAEKQEWAVKGYLSAKTAKAWLLEAEPSWAARRRALAAAPGKRYFQEKQLDVAAQREIRRWGRQATAEILDALQGAAVEAKALKPQPTQLSGKADEMALNLAFLLAKERVEEFRTRVDSLARRYVERGLALECTGPWPPFSFCPSFEETFA